MTTSATLDKTASTENLATNALLPRTFCVHLRKPFGPATHNAYMFNVHAENEMAVAEWLGKVFPGLDLQPMLARWGKPYDGVKRVGYTTPTLVSDVDKFSVMERIGSSCKPVRAPLGHHRKTVEQIRMDLEEVLDKVKNERVFWRSAFKESLRMYERMPTKGEYLLLKRAKQNADMATIWIVNLERELSMRPDDAELVMPEIRHEIVAG